MHRVSSPKLAEGGASCPFPDAHLHHAHQCTGTDELLLREYKKNLRLSNLRNC
jgi:hypothetical protein